MVANHAVNIRLAYAATVDAVGDLDGAIDAFIAAPSAATLAAARTAWIDARRPYRPTEVFRFYGGPIDDPADEREPRINAWPLDEAYIDHVDGDETAGIINDPVGFPTLDAAALSAANFVDGESNVMVGWHHAIEFLLWGQDLSTDGPGDRPHTDYLDGGTAFEPDRRRAYLGVVSDLLLADVAHVAGRWDVATGDYTAVFEVDAVATLTRMLTGMGTLAASELSGERMLTAYENKDQEDEHSCFSDTTLDDILGNATGLQDVYLGRGYGGVDGPGLDELVAARDPDLDARVRAELAAVIDAIDAIPGPFDQAILGADTDAGRVAILAAIRALPDGGRLRRRHRRGARRPGLHRGSSPTVRRQPPPPCSSCRCSPPGLRRRSRRRLRARRGVRR